MIFSLFSLGYVLAAGVALVLAPRFGWQSAFIVAIVPAVALFVVRQGITGSHRYVDVRASGTAKQLLLDRGNSLRLGVLPAAGFFRFRRHCVGRLDRSTAVSDTYIAELFPTVLRGNGFSIAVGGGRVVPIAAPRIIGWAITR